MGEEVEAPPFQEASQCAVCSSSFSAFRRRHHCRSCGRSLCAEHSSYQMALPRLGINSPVRVCQTCFEAVKQDLPGTSISDSCEDISRLSLSSEKDSVPDKPKFECHCGMPLCICEAPQPLQDASTPSSQVLNQQSAHPKPKKTSSSAPPKSSTSSSSGSSLPSLFFTSGTPNVGSSSTPTKEYNATGEGMREAVKNNDMAGVKGLIAKGVDTNYCDRQGMSLLHIASMFNFTDMTFLLMDEGARVDAKNAQGETPLDCAQPTLRFKMQQKITSATGPDFSS